MKNKQTNNRISRQSNNFTHAPRGVLWISGDRDVWMGAKLKTQKSPWASKTKPKQIPGPKFTPPPLKSHAKCVSHKNFQKALNDTTWKIETLVLNTSKNPFLNQATPKITCQNFPTQKNPQIKNFNAPKILRSSLSLEIRSTPLDMCVTLFCPFAWLHMTWNCLLLSFKESVQ